MPEPSITDSPAPGSDLPRYQPLALVLAAACAGILADSYLPLHLAVWLIAAAAALAAWCLLARRGRRPNNGADSPQPDARTVTLWTDQAASLAILAAVAAAAAAWHHCQWNLLDRNDLGNCAAARKQPVALEAIVLTAPRPLAPPESSPLRFMPGEQGYRVEICPTAIRDADAWIPVSGRAMLLAQGEMPQLQAGDRIRIFGELSAPPPAHNPGQFDRAAYLRSRRILSQVQAQGECISLVEPAQGWGLSRWLDRLRTKGSTLFEQYLYPRQAELAQAVFLGQREQIDYDRNEAFMATGTIHILSISGLHVGILAGAMLFLLRWLPVPRAMGLGLVALVTGLYALMVDVNPPVVRATILVLVTCLSMCLGRPALSFNSLAAAALIVLIINPNDLFSVGAQLSFLSVAVIMWVCGYPQPPSSLAIRYGKALIVRVFARSSSEPDMTADLREMVERNYGFVSRDLRRLLRWLLDLVLIGAAIWAVTQPLVAARFHLFSPIALVLNAVLWLPMTLGLLSGFAFLFLAMALPPLAYLAAYCCNLNLWLLEKGIDAARAVPGSHFWVPGPANWWLAGFYGGLAAWAVFPKIRSRPRWCLALLAGWFALGFAASFARHDSNRLHCTVLSVGHGSAVVLELPCGKTMLYDAGQFSAPARAAHIITGMLWSRGINRIDAVVLSHADTDHYNALPDVLEKCSVGAVYVSPYMFARESSALHTLHAALNDANVPVHEIQAGDHIDAGPDCRIEVLHPSNADAAGNDNAHSLVLAVEYAGHRIILPGDLESPGLEELLSRQPMPCDALLAPHHGSRQSNSPGLAAWCRPEWVILSGDGRWSTPEIDSAYHTAGSRTVHTFQSGAVEVILDRNGAEVKTFVTQQPRPEGE